MGKSVVVFFKCPGLVFLVPRKPVLQVLVFLTLAKIKDLKKAKI